MKKNLLSIIILFLLIVNISLTSVMVFSLVVTNQRALSLMTDVATVLRLELPAMDINSGEFIVPDVPIKNVETYDVAAGEAMTIPLKMGAEDTGTRYIVVSASLSMDSKNKGYKANSGPDLSKNDSLIQDVINQTFAKYTLLDVQDQSTLDRIRTEIVIGLHGLYGSDFVFNVSLRNIRYQ